MVVRDVAQDSPGYFDDASRSGRSPSAERAESVICDTG
jgi:hypothetical protein